MKVMLNNYDPLDMEWEELSEGTFDGFPMENDGYDYSFDDFDSGSWEEFILD
jgi:hypothetical protein